MQKRLTYGTADGKRHWTPLFDPPITLGLLESAKFGPDDMKFVCRSRDKAPRASQHI
jgi:hypothetical protein